MPQPGMPMGQPGMPPGPGYGPPKRSSSAGPIIAIGCGALALIVILVVVVLAIIGANTEDDPDPYDLPTPTRTYTPPDDDTPTPRATGGLVGNFTGDGNQPGSRRRARGVRGEVLLIYSTGVATYTYPSGAQDKCYTRLSLLSSEDDKVEYRETPMAGMDEKECASGYVTFIPSASGATMRWEWRQSRTATSPAAYGTVSKS